MHAETQAERRDRRAARPHAGYSAEKDWPKWLGQEAATQNELKALLVPFADDALKIWPVNRQKIGNVRNKEREVALPEAAA